MNKPTQEEQLRVFNGIVSNYFGGNIYPYGQCREEDVCISIRALIEHGPEVTEETFEKFFHASFGNNRKHIKEALFEYFDIRVTVKEGK